MSVDDLAQAGFDADVRNHARAILERDFREPLAELCGALLSAEVGAVSEFDVTPPTDRQRRKVDDAHRPVVCRCMMFVGDKFGAATTHWTKLQDRLARGVGNPCPLFLVGIPANVVKG